MSATSVTQYQARRWWFTHFPAEDVGLELPDFAKYMCYGVEYTPTTNRLHYQGYIECKRPKTMKGLYKWLPDSKFGICRGTAEQNGIYCKKDGTFFEFGTPGRQGARTDIEEYRNAILEGKTDYELINEFPEEDCKYWKWGIRVRNAKISHDAQVSKHWKKGYVFWGDTETGKTEAVHQEMGECFDMYYKLGRGTGNSIWFDGYMGQPVLLIDEFEGEKDIPWNLLLSLLHNKPCSVQCKGGYLDVNFDKVYITSNHFPATWYPNKSQKEQEPLFRRFAEIRKFTKQKEPDA